jgi:hypothetical protein
LLIRAIQILQEAMQERSWQMMLGRHPGGVIGTHTDGGKMPVAQHKWHLDHAPSLQDVLNRRGAGAAGG